MPNYALLIKFFSLNVILNWKRRIFISKEKTKKKKVINRSGGFQKSKFFKKKYYQKCVLKKGSLVRGGVCFENVRVEIFFKTRRARTCFFVNQELIFALFFFDFFILISFILLLWLFGLCEMNRRKGVFGKGVKF